MIVGVVASAGGIIPLSVNYLVIGGGGGGRRSTSGSTRYGGGGGAGGYRSTYAPVPGTGSGNNNNGIGPPAFIANAGNEYVVTVGAGGAVNAAGSASVFNNVTSLGGGGVAVAGVHGSGAGQSINSTGRGAGTAGQGFDGGFGNYGTTAFDRYGGGGGGSYASGTLMAAAAGGTGIQSVINAIQYVPRAGGGGGARATSPGGNPGSGGAGRGSGATTVPPGDGLVNTGSGGGGSYYLFTTGGAGGSGVVIMRYPKEYTISWSAGLTGSVYDGALNTFYVVTFTAGTGTVSWS